MSERTIQLEADYLVIGAGAAGMAFVDELIHHTKNVSVIIVDKHPKPGGHWNDSYNFVTLHQPATFYGVNSKSLEKHGRDLATWLKINAYYEHIMEDLLGTGRVRFFPFCIYSENGVFTSTLAKNVKYEVNVRIKTVFATYISPTIPLTHEPNFEVSDGVNFIPVNGLSMIKSAWDRYLIIGGGKTSCDAIVYLLDQSVDPNLITWVVPNTTWYFNRNLFYPDTWVQSMIDCIECILKNKDNDVTTLFHELEEIKFFFRIDTDIEPTRFKGATISYEDIEKLRLIKKVVRNYRIRNIQSDSIIFIDDTKLETNAQTLHVDCSANGSSMFKPRKIFDGSEILIQDVKSTQTSCSGALIGRFEAMYPDDEKTKNDVLKPIYRHQTPAEFFICFLKEMLNEGAFTNALGGEWVRECRLHPLYHVTEENYVKFGNFIKEQGEKLMNKLNDIVKSIEILQRDLVFERE